jgi:hypothetical protein
MSYNSIVWYSKSKNSIPLNRRLRSKNKLNEEQSMHYRNILSEMYKHKSTHDIQLYRGISKLTSDKVKLIFDKPHLGFISTTKIKDYTFFTSPYLSCCLLIINVPNETPMLDITEYSKYKEEEEIILPPGILSYKGEYTKKLDNYLSDTYMKVYICDYQPLSPSLSPSLTPSLRKLTFNKNCLKKVLKITLKEEQYLSKLLNLIFKKDKKEYKKLRNKLNQETIGMLDEEFKIKK